MGTQDQTGESWFPLPAYTPDPRYPPNFNFRPLPFPSPGNTPGAPRQIPPGNFFRKPPPGILPENPRGSPGGTTRTFRMPNRFLYHWTFRECLPRIARFGLLPKTGEDYRYHYREFNDTYPDRHQDIFPCVFLAPNKDTYEIPGGILLRIPRKSLEPAAISPDIVMDPRRRCVRYSRRIPPEHIRIASGECWEKLPTNPPPAP